MTSKELILSALQLKETSRVPWVPYVGVHGGKLLSIKATEYLTNAENMVNGIQTAINLYHPDGIPVAFDLQLEAEALGCKLLFTNDNPPAVTGHVLISNKTLEDLKIPSKNDARIPVVLEATKILRRNNSDIAFYGLVTGPFTLALHLLGTEIFTKMYDEPEYIVSLMDFCTDVALAMSDYYIEAGCDVIALVDPMTSQIDPVSFEIYVKAPMAKIFACIREKGVMSSFFVCGYAEHNLELMCQCQPDNISVDENIPLPLVKDIALAKGISFGGNLKLTTTLLLGTPQECEYDALECMDTGGLKGFILAPGCDLPMDTPVENLKAVSDLVHDSYRQDVLRNTPKTTEDIPLIDISHRYNQGKVVVDVITLDSLSCAPCQYMVSLVQSVVNEMNTHVMWKEHKIKTQEGLSMMASIGAKNIPTICINGNIEFVSITPSKEEFLQVLKKYL